MLYISYNFCKLQAFQTSLFFAKSIEVYHFWAHRCCKHLAWHAKNVLSCSAVATQWYSIWFFILRFRIWVQSIPESKMLSYNIEEHITSQNILQQRAMKKAMLILLFLFSLLKGGYDLFLNNILLIYKEIGTLTRVNKLTN